MVPEYLQPIDSGRRPWQRRIEVYSPKLERRMTLFSYPAHSAWVLLEADPRVQRFCERPALRDDDNERSIDFWIDYGRRQEFWLLSSTGDAQTFPERMYGLRVQVIQREDLVALATRIRNWSAIVPYLNSHRRFADPRLAKELYGRLIKPHRLGSLEQAFAPVDPSAIRAALFGLLVSGKLLAPELDHRDLDARTLFKRTRA